MNNAIKIPSFVKEILTALDSAGYEAFIVGGCVRDSIIGRKPNDYDVTTNATPLQVKEVFRNYNVVDTGIKHGTVSLIHGKKCYEITTYRTETVYTDHRHPDEVHYSSSLKEDLRRRDFTINAMAYNEKTGLVDYFGGIDDLGSGIIRCVGDPNERFQEDALRILRALRFASRFEFAIEKDTEEALYVNKELLKEISVERIFSEFTEILCCEYAEEYLARYADIFTVFLPVINEMVGFDQCNIHHIYDLWTHTIKVVGNCQPKDHLRWAALLHDIGKLRTRRYGQDGQAHFYGHPAVSVKMSDAILKSFHTSNAFRKKVLLLVEYHDFMFSSIKTVRKLLMKFNYDLFLDLLDLKRADNLAQSPDYRRDESYYVRMQNYTLDIIARNEALHIKDLKINGNDLMDLGFKGEQIGAMLEEALDLIVNEKIVNQKEILINYFRHKLNCTE